ncbi:alpha/beta fold hydrolase, partial [uncultured Phenylobacterium sp.]|uniref:alpha/beta fold hydrolase n=1 Tax=uncultured Phenylobacterium sp. TaxID=349273 RepID=UPI0025D712BC
MRASRIRIGDDTFHYADQGRGPPVVFLHGAPGDLRTWRDVIAALGGGCRAVAYTQRWFGRVAWRADGPPFGTATHVADLFAFIEALDLAPVSLVAWSYSGHVALKAALERPERFARVLIYEPSVPTYVSDPAQQAACGADAAQRFGPVFEALGRRDNRLAVQR